MGKVKRFNRRFAFLRKEHLIAPDGTTVFDVAPLREQDNWRVTSQELPGESFKDFDGGKMAKYRKTLGANECHLAHAEACYL